MSLELEEQEFKQPCLQQTCLTQVQLESLQQTCLARVHPDDLGLQLVISVAELFSDALALGHSCLG